MSQTCTKHGCRLAPCTQTQLGSKREDHQALGLCCHEQLWTEEAELTIELLSRQAGMAVGQDCRGLSATL